MSSLPVLCAHCRRGKAGRGLVSVAFAQKKAMRIVYLSMCE